MGLPNSPLDAMRETVCPLKTEKENFLDNVQLYQKSAQFLSLGAAIFMIIMRQKDHNRGFDDASCQKVIENLEKSRYLSGMLIQSFYHFECFYSGVDVLIYRVICKFFESQFEKQLEYEKKKKEHITRVKIEDTQEDLIKKMLKKKLNKTSLTPITKESKINIKRLTENDTLGRRDIYANKQIRLRGQFGRLVDKSEHFEGFSTK